MDMARNDRYVTIDEQQQQHKQANCSTQPSHTFFSFSKEYRSLIRVFFLTLIVLGGYVLFCFSFLHAFHETPSASFVYNDCVLVNPNVRYQPDGKLYPPPPTNNIHHFDGENVFLPYACANTNHEVFVGYHESSPTFANAPSRFLFSIYSSKTILPGERAAATQCLVYTSPGMYSLSFLGVLLSCLVFVPFCFWLVWAGISVFKPPYLLLVKIGAVLLVAGAFVGLAFSLAKLYSYSPVTTYTNCQLLSRDLRYTPTGERYPAPPTNDIFLYAGTNVYLPYRCGDKNATRPESEYLVSLGYHETQPDFSHAPKEHFRELFFTDISLPPSEHSYWPRVASCPQYATERQPTGPLLGIILLSIFFMMVFTSMLCSHYMKECLHCNEE